MTTRQIRGVDGRDELTYSDPKERTGVDSVPRPYSLQTTVRLARESGSTRYGYGKITNAVQWEHTPIGLDVIAESAGLDEALWSLQCVIPEQQPLALRFGQLFSARVASAVLGNFESYRPGDERPRNAIRATRQFAFGEIGDDDWDTARVAAQSAASDVDVPAGRCEAWNAARAASGASPLDVAKAAAKSTAWAAIHAVWNPDDDTLWEANYAVAHAAAEAAMKSLFLSILRGQVALDNPHAGAV